MDLITLIEIEIYLWLKKVHCKQHVHDANDLLSAHAAYYMVKNLQFVVVVCW